MQYMLMDFTANSHGNNILSNGQPIIYFRPLLCASL